ncbi:hypothetical protein Lfu02_70600 [Longispora fulva]|uniref:Sugar-specific transcriptional regulator TrmB/DNA-binding CsgD family transcriptional regulator n=1 Tax=Longispora fulva TaxID=619741 RepID=A0A8J7G7L7_9ACTN|nr:LuxR family transcriptional regulator [Longispora fulva]MBG6134395.1 sugar-specific transcriptional regulator TrmB/DNA-binding CsgD family transcriptional regulator [Longispora fulva]GIG62688.1 hypothetical protein Lfu02_70600 [Longispora fulva]
MDDNAGLLTVLGVSTEEETVYRALLAHPGSTLAALADATGWDRARVRRRTVALEDLGLLTRMPSRPLRFAPAPPDLAVELLALSRREEIERARIGAARLAEEFQAAPAPAVHVVRGREAVAQRLTRAARAARNEVLVLGRVPFLGGRHELAHELLARGVGLRAVHRPAELDSAEELRAVRDLVDRDAQARVLDAIPLELVIVDRGTALVPVVLADELAVVELRSSALLDGYVALFDLLWQRATPLFPVAGSDSGTVLTRSDEEILALCAAGLTDRTIARRLGVAQRTVERRMHDLMDRLGARTRFQAGLRAAGHGFGGDPCGGMSTGRDSATSNC